MSTSKLRPYPTRLLNIISYINTAALISLRIPSFTINPFQYLFIHRYNVSHNFLVILVYILTLSNSVLYLNISLNLLCFLLRKNLVVSCPTSQLRIHFCSTYYLNPLKSVKTLHPTLPTLPTPP